jgi:hypothetical protein
MISKKLVLKYHGDYKTLINAVINRVGMDAVQDINNYGIANGYNGFIYTSDTHAFAMRYRKLIVKLLEQQADDMGEDVVTMVSNFGIFRNDPMDNDDRKDLYKYLGGGKCEQSTITNLMAWFAAEEVCRMFDYE